MKRNCTILSTQRKIWRNLKPTDDKNSQHTRDRKRKQSRYISSFQRRKMSLWGGDPFIMYANIKSPCSTPQTNIILCHIFQFKKKILERKKRSSWWCLISHHYFQLLIPRTLAFRQCCYCHELSCSIEMKPSILPGLLQNLHLSAYSFHFQPHMQRYHNFCLSL